MRPPPLPCPRRRWSKKKGLARSVTHSAPASSTSSGPSHIAAERRGAERLGGAGPGPAGARRRCRGSGRAAPTGHGAAPVAMAPPGGPAPSRQRERGPRLRRAEVEGSSPGCGFEPRLRIRAEVAGSSPALRSAAGASSVSRPRGAVVVHPTLCRAGPLSVAGVLQKAFTVHSASTEKTFAMVTLIR